jgi:kynurenine formamidase
MTDLDEAQFRELYQRLKNMAWGRTEGRGGLHNITPHEVRSAADEVRLGRTVSLAVPIANQPAPDDPEPARHEMTSPSDGHAKASGLDFAMDRFAMNVHGNADSHLDALCHVLYDGKLFDGIGAECLTRDGATALSVDLARNGIVGRGVLLDIPGVRGVPWLEPGDCVTADDLAMAEETQHVHLRNGDVALIRVGHHRRRREAGPWNVSDARAGIHPEALEWFADRRIAALGSDSNNDTAPSRARGVEFPVHVLAVNALGLHLLDYLQFEELRPLCVETGRWSFLVVVAPLRLPTATGSPVNPIAVL